MDKVMIGGRYRVLRYLGSGGIGEVYEVEDLLKKRFFALKLAKDSEDGVRALHLKREFFLLSELTYPHIIKVEDFGVTGEGYPYFTMEYIEGKNILNFLRGRGVKFNPPTVYQILAQICLALQQIHGRGWIHGDLKPENIFILKKGKNSFVKLLDFGWTGDPSLQMGTLGYSAPEVLKGEEVDGRADLFSLGVILYEALTGGRIYQEKEMNSLLRKIFREDLPSLKTIVPSISEEVDEIVRKMLYRDPERRWGSAGELLEHLNTLTSLKKLRISSKTIGEETLMKPPFLGREEFVKRFSRLFNRAQNGRGRTLILSGERGVGKSRLIQEFKFRSQLEGAIVLSVNFLPQSPSWGVFIESLIRQIILQEEGVQHVEPLRIEVEGMPDEVKKMRIFERVTNRLLEFFNRNNRTVQLNAPTIILIDDLHHGSPLSLEFFIYLTRSILTHPIFLIATCEEIPSLISEEIERAGSESLSLHFLEPFNNEESALFISHILGMQEIEGLTEWIYQGTGGNPLLIEETLKFLVEKNVLKKDGRRWFMDRERLKEVRVPSGIEKVLERRLTLLKEEERKILNLAAVLQSSQGDFDLSLLREIFSDGSEEGRFFLLVNQLECSHLIRRVRGTRYSFSFGWMGRFLYEGIEPEKRIEAHRRVFENLKEREPQEAIRILAHHALEGGMDEGVELALRAAEEARRDFDLDTAIDFYEKALDILETREKGVHQNAPTIEKDEIGKILEAMGDIYEVKGEYVKAIEAYEKVTQDLQFRGSAQGKTAPLLRKIGKVHIKQSLFDRAMDYFKKAFDRSSAEGGEVERLIVLNEMAWGYRSLGKLKEGMECGEKALYLGRERGNPDLISHTHYILSVIHWNLGNMEEAVHHCEESLSHAKSLFRKATGLGFLGLLFSEKREFERAKEYYEECLTLQKKIGDVYNQASTHINLGILYQEKFLWEEAIRLFEEALSIGRRIGDSQRMGRCFLNLGNLYSEKGEWKKAVEFYRKSLGIRRRIKDLSGAAMCRNNLGNILLQMGEYEEGVRELKMSRKIQRKIGDKRGIAYTDLTLGDGYKEMELWKWALRVLERSRKIFIEEKDERGLVWVYLHQGEVYLGIAEGRIIKGMNKEKKRLMRERGLKFCEKGLELAMEIQDQKALGVGYRILGRIDEDSSDDVSKGWDYFMKSIEIFRRLKIPFELGRSLLEFGVWQLRLDNRNWLVEKKPNLRVQSPKSKVFSPTEVLNSLREAERIFKDLGARVYLERARSSIDSLMESLLSGHYSTGRGEKYLNALYQVSEIVNAIQDERILLERVLDIVIHLLGAERGLLLLKNEMSGDLFLAGGREVDEETLKDVTEFSRTITMGVTESGKPILSGDALSDERFREAKSVFIHNIRSLLCVPLVSQKEILGTLYVESRVSKNLFSEDDESFLFAIARLIGITIEKSRFYQALQSENLSLRRERGEEIGFGNMVGRSREIEEVYEMAGRMSQDDCTVLITGETGTGKGLLAKAIHENGKRGGGRFLPIHCGALPQHLLESELFGHKKGAFTDAVEDKPGLFEEASGGTIFLDEIGDAPLSVQTKLLHVIEEGTIRRIGETKERKVDVRVICATRRNLEEEIRAMRFREDLYYRLNVFNIQIPPLRDREEDISLLAHYFLRDSASKHNKRILGFEPEVMETLVLYPWPGNVRELRHCVERAVLLSKGNRISVEDIKSEVREVIPMIVTPPSPLPSPFHRREEIVRVLKKNRWNISHSAKELGVTYRHLRRLILKFKIDKRSKERDVSLGDGH